MRPRNRHTHTAEWHEARLAEGPAGYIRNRGAHTWDRLSEMCQQFMAGWEAWPEKRRRGYAFPNPEDR